jgi:CelD/BcsL family acetyltransferase involved in cellulose biosynthesis
VAVEQIDQAGSVAQPAVDGEDSLSIVVAEEISGPAAEWDALCDRLDVSPSLRPGWFSAWWEGFGSGQLELLLARRGNQLTGVMPLVRTRSTLASPTNWHSPEFAPVADDKAVERALIEEALSRTPRRLELSFVPDNSVVERLSGTATQMGWRVIVRLMERSPYLELEGDWEEFERRLPSKRRTDLRRRKRRLEELGSYRFDCEDGSERLAELVAEGIEVEAAGWEGRHGTAIAAEPSTRRFYEQIAAWAGEAGYLRLFFLRIDGKPIAFAFCLVDSQTLEVLKIGFDPSYARFAPGLLLTREMVAYAFGENLRTYDFLGTAEPYKLIWTKTCRDRMRLHAFPHTVTGLAHYLSWKYGRPVVKRVLRR